jgi:hypothetical protein
MKNRQAYGRRSQAPFCIDGSPGTTYLTPCLGPHPYPLPGPARLLSTLPTLLESGTSTASATTQSPVPASELVVGPHNTSQAAEPPQPPVLVPELRPPCPRIVHGEPLTDRKSTTLGCLRDLINFFCSLSGKFVAHMARVSAPEEIQQVLQEIRADRAYGGALHHISAVRLRPAPGKPLVSSLAQADLIVAHRIR